MSIEKIKAYAEKALPHYLECALWADGEQFEEESLELSADAREIAAIDVLYFVRTAYPWLDGVTPDSAGHNLWLSRNGHGSGFWDREFKFKDMLHEKAQGLGACDLYSGDNNELYFS